ncbi:MAG: hypothetical protein DMG61_24240, partial [Acidobacteria bacterium]
MPALANSSTLQDAYQAEAEKIRERFEQSYNGQAAIRERSNLIDSVVSDLWNQFSSDSAADRVCIAALGGYGRRALFPFSDVDLLFLYGSALSEETGKRVIPQICQALWDRHLRVSPTTRSLGECGKLYRDNLEFNISLLDCRYICGDAELCEQLRSRVIPKMVGREALELQQRLIDLTSARHNKYGHTIFHLEPNLKDCPGGLRDYQVACWLSLISELEKTGVWPAPENLLPGAFRKECSAALDFLSDV